jgi:hypothetical protein
LEACIGERREEDKNMKGIRERKSYTRYNNVHRRRIGPDHVVSAK